MRGIRPLRLRCSKNRCDSRPLGFTLLQVTACNSVNQCRKRFLSLQRGGCCIGVAAGVKYGFTQNLRYARRKTRPPHSHRTKTRSRKLAKAAQKTSAYHNPWWSSLRDNRAARLTRLLYAHPFSLRTPYNFLCTHTLKRPLSRIQQLSRLRAVSTKRTPLSGLHYKRTPARVFVAHARREAERGV